MEYSELNIKEEKITKKELNKLVDLTTTIKEELKSLKDILFPIRKISPPQVKNSLDLPAPHEETPLLGEISKVRVALEEIHSFLEELKEEIIL